MNGIIGFIIVYIILLVCWLIVNIFFYALTVVTRKGLFSVPLAINVLLNWGIQIYFFIYPFYFVWQIVTANWGDWLAIGISVLIGLLFLSFFMGLWQMVVGLFTYPIAAITIYFSGKASEKLDTKEQEGLDYEVISPKGQLIGKFQSEGKTDKKLAIYFVADYLVNLLYILTHPQQYTINGLFDFIFTPAFFMLQAIVMFGLVIGIYNLIRYRKFVFPDKKVFLTTIFKLDIIVLVGMQVIATILYAFIS